MDRIEDLMGKFELFKADVEQYTEDIEKSKQDLELAKANLNTVAADLAQEFGKFVKIPTSIKKPTKKKKK